jgi:hypothetical protein
MGRFCNPSVRGEPRRCQCEGGRCRWRRRSREPEGIRAPRFLSLPLVGRVAGRRPVGWGIQGTENAFHHPREIGINVRIPESRNSEALRLQKGIANLIRPGALRHSVLTAICFDNESRSERNEVDDVTVDRCLSPEMEAERLQFAQLHPQFDFLRRETFTKCASIFVCQGSPPPEGTPSHAIAFAASEARFFYPSPCGEDGM